LSEIFLFNEREYCTGFTFNRWQSASTFDQLKIPKKDKNINLIFNFYEPILMSYYQASWTELKILKGKRNMTERLNSTANFLHMSVYLIATRF
jgi:endoglucanase